MREREKGKKRNPRSVHIFSKGFWAEKGRRSVDPYDRRFLTNYRKAVGCDKHESDARILTRPVFVAVNTRDKCSHASRLVILHPTSFIFAQNHDYTVWAALLLFRCDYRAIYRAWRFSMTFLYWWQKDNPRDLRKRSDALLRRAG